MKKRVVAVLLASVMCALAPTSVWAGGDGDAPAEDDAGFPDDDGDDYPDDEDEDDACSIGLEDLCVKPAKKIVAKGSTFKIKVAMKEGSIFEELSDEEWDAIYEHDVANVEFRSNRPSIAKVNSVTGTVKAKKKGSCRITTMIYLIDGTAIPLRTTVLVSR